MYVWRYSCHQGKRRRGEIWWDADVTDGVNLWWGNEAEDSRKCVECGLCWGMTVMKRGRPDVRLEVQLSSGGDVAG